MRQLNDIEFFEALGCATQKAHLDMRCLSIREAIESAGLPLPSIEDLSLIEKHRVDDELQEHPFYVAIKEQLRGTGPMPNFYESIGYALRSLEHYHSLFARKEHRSVLADMNALFFRGGWAEHPTSH